MTESKAMIRGDERNVKVIGVETIDEDLEKFELVVKRLPCELILSRTRQPITFNLLMNALRDNTMLNNEILFNEINNQVEQEKENEN